MKQFANSIKLFTVFAIASVLLSSCGMHNKFASSFGKRRYMKGFYADVPGPVKTASGNTRTHKPAAKVFVEIPLHNANVQLPQYAMAVPMPVKFRMDKPGHRNTAIAANGSIKNAVPVKTFPVISNTHAQKPGAGGLDIDASPFSWSSLYVFLGSLTVFLIVWLISLLTGGAGALVALGLVVAVLGELIALILAILAITNGEYNLMGAEIVLGAFVIGLLIFIFSGVFK